MENEKVDTNVRVSTPAPSEEKKSQEPVKEAPVVRQPDGKVLVDEKLLKTLVSTVEEQGEKIKDLTAAADIGRLTRIQAARSNGKIVKNAKVSTWEGKIVVGWAKVTDDVYFDEQGKLHEDQQIKLFVKDGEKTKEVGPMSYRQFARVTTKIEGEVIRESKNSDGTVEFTVQLPDGNEVTLPIVFLN